jgi:hypothetical protein
MALASGVPVPQVYVMDGEPGGHAGPHHRVSTTRTACRRS